LKKAKELIKDKCYTWNSGIFLFKAKTIINEIKELNPEIEIELIFDDKELDLSTRQADIGIFMRRPKQLNYIQKKLIDLKYYIYGSNKYLEKYGMPKTVSDLNKHKFISFGKGAPSPVYNPDWALKLGMHDGKKRKTITQKIIWK